MRPELMAEMDEDKADALPGRDGIRRSREEVRHLLRYPERTVGRAMTTTYHSVLRPTTTVNEVIENK